MESKSLNIEVELMNNKNKNIKDVDNKDALKAVNKFAEVVKSKYDFVKVFLFGSYAKGSFDEDSDIDIAVILKDYKNLMDVQLDLMRLRRKTDSRIEPHPFRENEFNLTNPMDTRF